MVRSPVLLLLLGCGRVGFDGRVDAASGDATDDASVSRVCNTISGLRDTFEGTSYAPVRWGAYEDPGTSITVTGGEVVIAPAPATATSAYAGLVAYRHYDLRGDRFVAEVTQVATNGAVVGVQLQHADDLIIISQQGSALVAAQRAPGYLFLEGITYSPSMHRFLAISESGGTIYWETSADGTTFAPFFESTPPFDVARVRPHLFAGSESPIASPGALHVTSVGSAGAAPQVCSSDQLTDSFADPSTLTGQWLNSIVTVGYSMAIAGGTIATQSDGSVGYTVLRSAYGYDLRSRDVDVELVQRATQVANFHHGLAARLDFNNKIELELFNDMWNSYEVTGGLAVGRASLPAMPTDRFLRIREEGGIYATEVSADRQQWRLVYSGPVPFSVGDVTLELEVTNNDAGLNADTVRWDNFNTP